MKLLNGDYLELWERFVKSEENYLPQHLGRWKTAIEEAYPNCKPIYYLDIEENKVKSAFPFFLVKSRIFGNRVISLPFLDNGGFLGEYNLRDVKDILSKLSEKNPRFIEIRLCSFMKNFRRDSKILKNAGFSEKSLKQQVVIKIGNKEKIWEDFDRDIKKGVNKGFRENLEIREISKNNFNDFYKLYLQNMNGFGSPPHSKKFFEKLFLHMKENIRVVSCYKDDKIIGSMVILFSRSYAYLAFNVSDSDYSKFRPNDFLYWNLIEWCSQKKIKQLDLGQVEKNPKSGSRAEGIKNFKLKWGGELFDRVDFSYSFSKTSGDNGDKKDKLKKFRGLWKRIPSFMKNKMGPKIASQIAS